MTAPDFSLNATNPGDLKDPLRIGIVVAPNDGTDLPFLPRAIHIFTAGTIRMDVGDGFGGVVTINTSLEAGWHPIRPSRIYSTGTLAAIITAWR
jgi:hypothetical protein